MIPRWAGCVVLVVALGAATPLGGARASDPDLSAARSDYKRPPLRPSESSAVVELGKALFWDERLSASGKTSCGSCHFPDLAWATREGKSRNDSGKPTSRKSQALIGLAYAEHPLTGWDGRNASLEAQAKSSVATGSMSMRETDTPVKVEVIEARIGSDTAYAAKFKAAFSDRPITLDAMAEAIAAYERTIEPGRAPFDDWADGNETAISDSAKRGFALFTSKAACFVCHSGWRFTNDSFHDIGTTTTDLGRGREVKGDVLM